MNDTREPMRVVPTVEVVLVPLLRIPWRAADLTPPHRGSDDDRAGDDE